MLTSLYKFRSSLHPHKLKHTKLPCPSPTHRDCSNSYPLNQWCHPNISSSVIHHPLYLLSSICPSIRVFFNESVLWFRCPKYWTFSISPSNEYSGIISFRINWFHLAPQFKSINSGFVQKCHEVSLFLMTLKQLIMNDKYLLWKHLLSSP